MKKFQWISYCCIGFVLLVTLFFAFQLPKSQLDYNFEEFFPQGDSSTQFFKKYRQIFHSDNDFVLVAIERKEGIFDREFLQKVHLLSNSIDSLPYVVYTKDITRAKETFIHPFGITGSRKYIHLDSSAFYYDSIHIYKNKELVNTLVNSKGNALLIFVKHEDYLSKKKGDQLVNNIHTLLSSYNFDKVRLAGRTVGQKYYLSTMLHEMTLYIAVGLVLILLFLGLFFRSFWAVLVPQLVLWSAVIWIFGYLALMDKPINILLIVLPLIMLVVAMSAVIHLISKYLDLLRLGFSKYEAIRKTIKEIGRATFLTSITTAIGFLSLLFVEVQPIQDFGLYCGISVLLAFVITYLTLPSLFYLTKVPKGSKSLSFERWERILRKICLFTLQKRKRIIWITSLTVVVFSFGITLIQSNSFLMDNISKESSIHKDFEYFDKSFGGIRPFELAIEMKDTSSSFWEYKHLKELQEIGNYLDTSYGVKVNNSMLLSLSILNRGAHAGEPQYFHLPSSQKEVKRLKRLLKRVNKGEYLSSFLDKTATWTRVSGRVPDWGSKVAREKAKDFQAFIQQNNLDKDLKITLTGSAQLMDKAMHFTSSSLMQSLFFAIGIVSLFMALLYRSVKMLLISLIPNLIPLIITAGIMGFLGIDLQITTALIFTISFGIAVDDTIHFLNNFNLERKEGKSKLYAIKNTYLKKGKAIILTSVVLVAGFGVLIFSDFMGIFYLGLLTSITLFVALLCDLLLLPILLFYFYSDSN